MVVIGGGVAGVSAASALAEGGATVYLVEREAVLAAHATGRNAAIFRQACEDPQDVALAARSAGRLDALFGERRGWMSATGAYYLSRSRSRLEKILENLNAHRIAAALLPFADAHALHVASDGILDPHAIISRLAAQARAHRAVIHTGVAVERLLGARQVRGVRLASGVDVACGAVVIAAGAWSARLGEGCAAPLPLRPLRRHLVLLEGSGARFGAVWWRVDPDEEVYLRPESQGVLCSPCDEVPCDDPEVDGGGLEQALSQLHRRLGPFGEPLRSSGVRRAWSCLRTFAADRWPVVGADPRVLGLYWLAGLGGHGMCAGPALGELLAREILQRSPSSPHRLRAARLLAPQRRFLPGEGR